MSIDTHPRKLAWIQTYTAAIISIGTVFGASGFSVLLTTLSQPYAGKHLTKSASVLGIPLFLTNGIAMMAIGAVLIAFGLVLGYMRIKRK